MRSRWFTLLAALLGLMLVATACGDDPTAPEEPAATDATTPADMEETTAPETDETTPAATDEATATETPAAADEELCSGEFADLEAPEGFRVGLVTDIGSVDDGTFNQFAYEGMLAAADCFGFETDVIETQSEADYEQNLGAILANEPSVVISVGFLLASATLGAAEQNPDVMYVGIDQFHEEFPDNYVGILFREDQGGFLAGVMAGLLTESNVVGVVAGREDVPPVVRFVNAYREGAHYIDDSITVLDVYHESFTDSAGGQSTAQQMMGEGADVIFGAGGLTGSGGVLAATQEGKWGIGVDQDEYFTTFGGGTTPGAEFLATSAIKRVDVGVFNQIAAAISGDFAGGIFTLTAENNGITYAPPHDADIPEDVLAQLEEVRQGLADESIDTGVDPITGQPL